MFEVTVTRFHLVTQTFVPLINSVVDHCRIIVPETQDYAKASSAGQRLLGARRLK